MNQSDKGYIDDFFERCKHRLRWLFPLWPIATEEITVTDIANKDKSIRFCAYVVYDLGTNTRHCAYSVVNFGAEQNLVVAMAAGARSLFGEIAEKRKVVDLETADHLGQIRTSDELIFPNLVHINTDFFKGDIKYVQGVFHAQSLKVHIHDDKHWQLIIKGRNPDFFICHAAKDKESFVEPLEAALDKRFLLAWYDKKSLKPGDSLVDQIDIGLRKCTYAVVVISHNFIENIGWARRELRNLMTRDVLETRRLIVPIWLGVNIHDVASLSLDLADRVAISANGPEDVDRIAGELQDMLIRSNYIQAARSLDDFKPNF